MLLAACSSEEEDALPAACRAGQAAVTRALGDAPEPVTLGGGTTISDCFARGGEAGDVQTVGFALTGTVAELAREARADPDGRAALELGYLVGAVRRGAERTPGLYDELARRVEQELHGIDTSSEAFSTGERAGIESG